MDNYADILHFMEILGLLISGIVCPLIVYFVISKHKNRSKPSKPSMSDFNNSIKQVVNKVNSGFK